MQSIAKKSLRERQWAALRSLSTACLLGAAGSAAAYFAPSPRFAPAASLLGAPIRPAVMRDAQIGTVLANPQSPLRVIQTRKHGVPFILIEGGEPQTRRSPLRCEVGAMVQAAGAQAGLNGTYFVDASVAGTDNTLIGPSLCGNEKKVVFNSQDRTRLLTGRPLVLLSKAQTRLVPYNPATMGTQDALESWLPGLTDVFLGGVWLVHHGKAADPAEIDRFQVHDAEDPRRRAFFCLLPDGRPALGATTYVTPSSDLAVALQAMGVQEAVLLDSGFSTSLVYGKKILVTGHTSPGIPSRPVPHALILFGKPAPSVPRSVLVASNN
jgi:biofilm PGA synthesis lipoprotein PgaB